MISLSLSPARFRFLTQPHFRCSSSPQYRLSDPGHTDCPPAFQLPITRTRDLPQHFPNLSDLKGQAKAFESFSAITISPGAMVTLAPTSASLRFAALCGVLLLLTPLVLSTSRCEWDFRHGNSVLRGDSLHYDSGARNLSNASGAAMLSLKFKFDSES